MDRSIKARLQVCTEEEEDVERPLQDPGVTYLSESPEEELCRRAGPVEEDLWDQSDGHLQDPQQTDGQVEAGRTHLEHTHVIGVVNM